MREPKDYKRSFKVLVNIFLILSFIGLSIAVDWSAGYYLIFGARTMYYVLACVSTVSASVLAEALTVLAMTGFHKLSTKDILNTKRKKTIFIVTTFCLTVTTVILNCCLLWAMV